MARLDAPARELVRTLAVAGRELTLVDASDRADVDIGEALPAAEDQGLLECTGERVRFRHALLRDAVYADIPAIDRVTRHARAADQLTGSHERAAEAAAHLRAIGQMSAAGELLVAAARQARAVGALADATDLLRDARNALPDDPAPALALADVLAWRGRPVEARSEFDVALPLLERAGDPAEVARAHLRYAEWHFRPSCEPRVAVAACRRALAVIDGTGVDAPDLRGQILAVYAWCESIGGELAEVDRTLALLEEFAGSAPADAYVDSMANSARCFSMLRQGRFHEAADCGIRGGDRALSAGRPEIAYTGLVNAAFGLVADGDLGGALRLLDRMIAALRGHGMLAAEARVQIARAWVLVRLGRIAEALEAAAEGRRSADRLDAPELQALVDAERGRVALRAGDYENAIELLTAALADPDAAIGRPLARLQRAEAFARLGAADEAEAELVNVALEPVRLGDWPDTLVARMTGVEGLIALARGDRALARRRLTAAADWWRQRRSPAELGQRMTDLMLDLGRPIIGLVVPTDELATVEADLASLTELTEV
jgi:tetratricopeptide (TPR) repeat protein